MNLDDDGLFAELDRQNMLGQINDLPDQLIEGWQIGEQAVLPDWKDLRQVVITGMGGSAIGADLLAAYARPNCMLPIVVHRNYDLPAFARGPQTLVIVSSHSGNTEETLSACTAAVKRGCRVLAITTGGQLSEMEGITVWKFNHQGQPRSAVGYSFALLLAAFTRLDLLPDSANELENAVQAVRQQQNLLQPSIPVFRNIAKREAGQLVGRAVTVFGSDYLEPVARRWKGQINEVAKAWGQFEFLPEADHNTLAGVINPEVLQNQMVLLFLRSASDHPRNRLRSDLTRQQFMIAGFNTDSYDAQGSTPLAHMWTSLHFGDFLAYYLAMAYQVDPTPVEAIENLKGAMAPLK